MRQYVAKVFVFFCVCLTAVYGKTQAEELIFGIITPTCFDSLVNRHEFGNIECLKFVLSKALGYAIICGSFILKAPQIIKILRAKDVTGLTPSTFYIEVIIFQSNTIYNVLRQYPISTWGENLVILVQNCLLVILMWQYSKPPTSIFNRLVYSILFFASTFAMMSLPPSQQWVLGSAAIPLSCASRIPQIWANFKQGHTGQLALITLLLNLGGASARLLTTIQETGDIIQLSGILISAITNAIMVLQVFIYWTATNKVLKPKTQ